jgi:hypothetical protein
MFASTKAVDAKIDALARQLRRFQSANLNHVAQPALGMNPEIGKDRVGSIGIDDFKFLRSSAQPAPVDLIHIAGAPVMRRRDLQLSGSILFLM